MSSTIDSLPNELLVKIFVLYRSPRGSHLETFGAATKPDRKNVGTLPPLMSVCRHWRAVILEAPLLWQAIDIGKSTQWLDLALARSRDVVLELYFHSYPTSVEALPMLMPLLHRVRTLWLPPMPPSDLLLLSSAQAPGFPVLEELGLWVNTPMRQYRSNCVPFDLSSTRLPALRVLLLQCAVVSWNAEVMSKLRFLHLHSCTPAEKEPSFAHLLDVLEGCHELEVLELHRVIARFEPPSPRDPPRTIRLPKLRELTLDDEPKFVRDLIIHVYVPETVEVHLKGSITDPLDDYILGILTGGFHSLLPINLSNIPVVRMIRDIWINLTDDEEQQIIGAIPLRSSAPLKLTLYSPHELDWEHYQAKLLCDFASRLKDVPLEGLRFTSGWWDPLHHKAWADLFRLLPTLRRLEVDTGGYTDVLLGLSGSSSDNTPLLPDLRSLKLHNIKGSFHQHIHLIAALRKRAQFGLPKLDYIGLEYLDGGATALQEAMAREGVTLGDLSSYVTKFECWPST